MGQATDTSVYTEASSRRASLLAILPKAKEDAKAYGMTQYVIHAPIHVDEYEEASVEHVHGNRAACEIMFPCHKGWKEAGIIWSIDASVEPDGSVFFTHVEDILATVESGKGRVSRIEIVEEDELGNAEAAEVFGDAQ